jgi:photosystem I P700 chlorophyll a apoprotein A1
MHFHGAYFSNYSAWLKDPKHCLPSSHLVWSLVGQDILNGYLGQYFSGITITSGFFQLWRSEGIITHTHLKYACAASLIGNILCITASVASLRMNGPVGLLSAKLESSVHIHHFMVMSGLGCMSIVGHSIHISLPINSLLDSGIHDPSFLELDGQATLANADLMQVIFPTFGVGPLVNLALFNEGSMPSIVGSASRLYSSSTASVPLAKVAAHHFALGVVFIIVGLIGYLSARQIWIPDVRTSQPQHLTGAKAIAPTATSVQGGQLSIALAICGSASVIAAHHLSAIPVYAFVAISYPTVLCLFCHHMWIGGFLIVGAGAHASLYYYGSSTDRVNSVLIWSRDATVGLLIWVSIATGFHSFGLYCHNDTLEALGRPEDTFCDNSIQLKPLCVSKWLTTPEIQTLDGRIVSCSQELGTADFMVHHIHAFTIHVTLLVLLKGLLYGRSSRLVSDKFKLGTRYPCDGPGRGGTCQISTFDHLYLAVFWMYNSLSVLLFHYFWKSQSDVWGVIDNSSEMTITHMSGGDFSVNATTINAWLRNFLWSQAAQAIQSYAVASICSFGFIFISAHFVWAFSLMFLYSGRAYWQELIESVVWAHHKLKIVPHVQPRALSISQGRSVGLTHYILGGIGCTWAFFISRVIVLTS